MSAPTALGPWLALLVGGLVGPAPQRTWQADIRIQGIEVVAVGEGSLSVRVQVASGEGGSAREARLEVLVPVGLEVLRVAPGCQPTPSAVPRLAGRVTCELGDLPVRGLRDVTLVTTRPRPGSSARFAAFVMSATPDPEPVNNFAERPAP